MLPTTYTNSLNGIEVELRSCVGFSEATKICRMEYTAGYVLPRYSTSFSKNPFFDFVDINYIVPLNQTSVIGHTFRSRCLLELGVGLLGTG